MHIPDGYLSPATCGVLTAAAVPFWVLAVRKVRTLVTGRFVPLMAIAAAFSFLVMMFNVPIPDGTSAHATGAAVTAIALGPWAAVITMTIALVIQALFFGDGGVLVFGANVFNMAIVLPFTAIVVYRWIAGRSALTSGRRTVAAGIAGYVGINVAAFVAAIEFGLQPDLFHTANGTPLYAPFHLAQTIPAMALAHLTVAGLAEFAFSFGIVAYLQRANLPVLRLNHPNVPLTEVEAEKVRREEKRVTWAWAYVPLIVMAFLVPLGLLAPGGAFGEDAPGDLDLAKYGLSAIPSGMNRFASFWSHTLFGGYGFNGGDHPVVGYVLSALVGTAICGALILGVTYLLRFLANHRRPRDDEPLAGRGRSTVHAAQRSTLTPRWLVTGEGAPRPAGRSGTHRKRSFVEKTLSGGANVMRQAIFSEDVAQRDGFLQRLDPRVKFVTLFGLLLVAAFLRTIPVLLAMYAATLVMAAMSRLPVGFFVKRVWLFIPIFTGIVVLPATLSLVTPGTIVLPLWNWHGQPVGLTEQGLYAAGLIVSRVAVSISLVVLLTLTTPWVKLLAALRALAVPKVFVLIVGMAYRYIFLLLNAVTDMYTARKARSAGNRTEVKEAQRFVTATAGALFGKAHALSEEVHLAMVARGYRGDAKVLTRFHTTSLDVAFVVGSTALAVAVLMGERLLGA